METAYETKLRIVVMVLAIAPTQINANATNCREIDNSLEYLDENVVFCLSRESLRIYMELAGVFDLDGMNDLVLKGKCNFVPSGGYLPLENYQSQMIDSEPVIATEVEDLTLWTFKKFVSEGSPEETKIVSGDTSMLAFVKNDQRSDLCR